MPSGINGGLRCANPPYGLHARLRVQRAPGIPRSPWGSAHALFGRKNMHNSGASRREKAEVYLSFLRHCERSEAIHSCFLVASWIASLRSQ
jgi:hypothetical protein